MLRLARKSDVRAWFRIPGARLGLFSLACLLSNCETPRPREHFGIDAHGSSVGGLATGPSGGMGQVSSGSSPSLGGQDTALAGSGMAGAGTGAGPVGAGGGGSGPEQTACVLELPSAAEFSRKLLREHASACVQYHYCRFAEKADALAEASVSWKAQGSAGSLLTAQRAWQGAIEEWSLAEAMQFGPAASAAVAASKDIYQGQGLRDLIQSWPVVARCKVDEQVALQKYKSLGMSAVTISGRGLSGLEALLFYSGFDTECAANSSTSDVWGTLSSGEIQSRRRDYAAVLGADVQAYAHQLVDLWSPSGQNFEEKFVSASGYPDEQEAMTILGWALMYVDFEVKDYKIGTPAQIITGAPVLGPEAQFAGIQSELLRRNLRGFREIFQGCGPDYSGVGFDDWLIAAGHGELADSLIAASEKAERTIGALGPFGGLTLAELTEAYSAVRDLGNLLETDLFGAGSPINLKVPASVEGDTD